MAVFNPAAGAPISALAASPGLAKSMYSASGIVAVSTALALNDTMNFFVLPRGAVIKSCLLRTSVALDSNGSPTLTLDVGDAALATRIFSASLAGSTATGNSDGIPVFAALGFQMTADTLIFGTVHAAAATKVAGSVFLRIDFTIDGLPS